MMDVYDSQSDKSNILLMTASYSPRIGGLETVVSYLASYFTQAGHNVSVITNRYPNSLRKKEMIDGISVERLQFLIPHLDYIKTGRLDLWLAGLIFFPITLIKLVVIVIRFRPDIINLHYLGDLGFFIWILHFIMPFRLVVSLHGGDVDGEPYQSRFKRWLFHMLMDSAEQVTVCSQALHDLVINMAPKVGDKTKVIHNGVNYDLFAYAKPFDHHQSYIFAVGQLVFHKGFDSLITAFVQVSELVPDIDLLIAGDGPELSALFSQIICEGLDGRVHLLGAVTRDLVAALMLGSLAVVIPSRREPFGIVGLEALASGKPIIATQIGGLVEALAGANVRWCLADDPSNLAAILTTLLKDHPQRTLTIRENKIRAQAYSWEQVADQYLYIFAG